MDCAVLASYALDGDAAAFLRYRVHAVEQMGAVVADYARLAGGALGPAECSFIESAARERAAQRYVYDYAVSLFPANGVRMSPDEMVLVTQLLASAARLGQAAKQNLLAAWEVAMRTGPAGGREGDPIDTAELMRRAEERASAQRAEERASAQRATRAAEPEPEDEPGDGANDGGEPETE